MTTEAVLELWNCLDLRQYIVDTAKGLSNRKKVQKDLVGHAWYVIGEARAQRTVEYYKRLCKMMMERRLMMLIYGETFIT